MIIIRLFDFYEQIGNFSTLQCGGRVKQATIDHLLSIEATVRNAQANSEQVVSIFFDMEKSYDLTRRHSNLMDLNEDGKEGRKINFIQKFLKDTNGKHTLRKCCKSKKNHKKINKV